MTPDVSTPFGTFAPTSARRHLLNLAQRAPRNLIGKQLARVARSLFLWRTPLPADISVGDIRLRCYLRDNTGERKFAFTPWRFDPLERGLLATALPPDGVFVDIGANVGIYTLTAALQLGASGRIIAIEPYPPARERLVFNIAATRGSSREWPRIEVLGVGISDREELRPLHIDAGNLGGGSIVGTARTSRAGSHSTTTVRCRPLLDVLVEEEVARVDVLKIDIEGAEDLALVPFLRAAAAALLPRRIIVENSEASWRLDLGGALAERGYARTLRTRLNSVYAR